MKNNPVIISSVLLIVLSSFAGVSITPTADNIPANRGNYKDYPQYLSHRNLESNVSECDTSFVSFSHPAVESNHANQPNVVRGDAVWQMQGFTRTHIGRCPYSTANNPGVEKWRFAAKDFCDGSPVIAADGTIYFGSCDSYFYAVNPDGTLKWKCNIKDHVGEFGVSPAIALDNTIYVGTRFGSQIIAIDSNGSEIWRFNTPDIDTSITLDDDGILYYGHHGGVDARYPNGTLKWRFTTQDYVQSTPAVDDNGTIYFGSHDYHIYAVYPNGTMKWSFPIGGWGHGSPTIAPDGTIYCVCDSGYLYALYQNGTEKWKVMVGAMRASPSLDTEGNIYLGVVDERILSVAPNGTIRWIFQLGAFDGIWGSTAAISDDGTLYVASNFDFGHLSGCEIIALNLDGTLKWRKTLSGSMDCLTSPVISAAGDVYLCSTAPYGKSSHLHAFGSMENNTPPNTPIITGPSQGKVRTYVHYEFRAIDPERNPVSFFVDFGDGDTYTSYDYGSNETFSLNHIWNKRGTYTIRCKATDTFGLESDWATLEVTMPKNQGLFTSHPILSWLFERFPNLFPILRYIFDI